MLYVIADEYGKISTVLDIPSVVAPSYAEDGITLVVAPEEMDGISPDTHYVLTGTVTERPVMGASLSGSSTTLPSGTLTLSGVLSGSTVTLANSIGQESSITADGTDITISVDFPGIWSVRVLLWPYREEVFDFESVL